MLAEWCFQEVVCSVFNSAKRAGEQVAKGVLRLAVKMYLRVEHYGMNRDGAQGGDCGLTCISSVSMIHCAHSQEAVLDILYRSRRIFSSTLHTEKVYTPQFLIRSIVVTSSLFSNCLKPHLTPMCEHTMTMYLEVSSWRTYRQLCKSPYCNRHTSCYSLRQTTNEWQKQFAQRSVKALVP